MSIDPGQLVDARFLIEAVAGTGGTGTVFRAWDQAGGRRVALKVLHDASEADAARLPRELDILGALRHPGIVRCYGHGAVPGVGPYLVLEWLDGESLAARLSRGPLSIAESIELGRCLAETLRELHRARVIHRDIKPTNVVCEPGAPGRARIIDFSIALRDADEEPRVTAVGYVVGSCAYMAPERASGAAKIGPASDVFSLGCVLFECLTGRRAYDGSSSTAILAKVVWEAPPRAADSAKVPRALDALISRMMSRDPAARPDAGAVARDLADLASAGPESAAPRDINVALERLFGVPLVDDLDEPTTADEPVLDEPTHPLPGEDDAAGPARPPALGAVEQRMVWVVAVAPSADGRLEACAPLVASFGARLYVLADGAGVALFTASGAPADDAMRAARCARALGREIRGARVALGTGRAIVGRRPVGQAVDGAVLALARCAPDQLRIDEPSAGLLGGAFAIRRDAHGPHLGPELPAARRTRTLMGRSTPFVGREPELAHLEATLRESALGVARAVLVLGDPGTGKSRLRYELVARAAAIAPNARIWLGRGDAMRAGSSFGVMASLVRDAFSLSDAEAADEWRDRISRAIAPRLDPGAAPRIASFLAELCGAPASELHDSRVVGDQIRRALYEWWTAETAFAPVVLVLEDLHWADAPSIECVGAALREMPDRPLFVLALSRPADKERLATALRGITMSEFSLRDLPKRAAERLVRATLGEKATDATVARLVDRAVGNALFLEELIRAEAEGRGHELPDTVLGMALARLDSLDARARRVLRAASILGRTVGAADLAAVLGDETEADVRRWLEHLADREFLTLGRGAAGGEAQYVFRHALTREASYESLTPDDRRLGHRLAGSALARRPAADASVVAEHLERGGALGEAIAWYERSAERALGGNDLASVLAHVEAATRCGAAGEVEGGLCVLASIAHEWRGEYRESLDRARRAISLLREGSDRWFDAVGQLVTVAGRLGDVAQIDSMAAALDRFAGVASATGSQRVAVARLALRAFYADNGVVARRAISWVEGHARHQDPFVLAWEHRAREVLAALERDDVGELAAGRAAAECFERAGDLRSAGLQRGNVGFLLMRLGANEAAEIELSSALATAKRIGAAPMEALALNNLGIVLARQGRFDEALGAERRAVEMFVGHGDRRMESGARAYLAWILTRAGAVDDAEAEARLAIGLASGPGEEILARGVLGYVYLQRGRAPRALSAVGRGIELLETEPGNDGEALTLLVHAEALHATGEEGAARDAILRAWRRLLERARTIRDPALHRSFLRGVPENARTLEHACTWGGAPPGPD